MSRRPADPENSRSMRRGQRKLGTCPVMLAFYAGEYAAQRRFQRNPYPPGKRHDAFEEGLKVGLLGIHHGRNY